MRRLFKATVLAAALSAASALPLAVAARASLYDIAFTQTGNGDPAFSASGSFEYDLLAGFSNFTVTWDSTNFDLTSSANATAPHYPLDACPSALTGAAFTFHMLTVCNTGSFANSYNVSDIGVLFSPGFTGDNVSFGGPSHAGSIGFDGVISDHVSGNNQVFAAAAFTVSEVPEPASALLLSAGLLTLAAIRRRGARS